MKNLYTLLTLALLVSLISCKKETVEEPPYLPAEIATVINTLKLSFDTMNQDMSATAALVAGNINDTAYIRQQMAGLCNRSTFSIEFSYVTPAGIMQIVEPSKYHYIQGSDISSQDHIIQCFQTKEPVLSQSFDAVEGFNAAVDIHPILSGQQLLGGITALFHPEVLLGRIIEPLVEGEQFEMWVMEKGGRTLYDQDAYEIGRNVITDTLYSDFPELIAAATLINEVPYGETTYSFYQTGTSTKVVKKAYWNTFYLYKGEWKIIWVKPE